MSLSSCWCRSGCRPEGLNVHAHQPNNLYSTIYLLDNLYRTFIGDRGAYLYCIRQTIAKTRSSLLQSSGREPMQQQCVESTARFQAAPIHRKGTREGVTCSSTGTRPSGTCSQCSRGCQQRALQTRAPATANTKHKQGAASAIADCPCNETG